MNESVFHFVQYMNGRGFKDFSSTPVPKTMASEHSSPMGLQTYTGE